MNGDSNESKKAKLDDFLSDEEDDNDDLDEEEPKMKLFDSEVKCLFCMDTFVDVETTLDHCSKMHDFNLFTLPRFDKSFLSFVKLVNFIRTRQKSLADLKIEEMMEKFEENVQKEDLLKPVIKDDPLLCFDIEDYLAGNDCELLEERIAKVPELENGNLDKDLSGLRKEDLISEVLYLRKQLKVSEMRCEEYEVQASQMKGLIQSLAQEENENASVEKKSDGIRDEDAPYFDSYDSLSIHEEMIQDKVRTESYRDFILGNEELFLGKTVVDLGCGTGILSLFAASAGARTVMAVDQSNIAKLASKVVADNSLESVIKVINGKAENLRLDPKGDPVHVIVSEWMGYFLLFECMLDSVIALRDRCGQTHGLVPEIVPRFYSMWLCALDDSALHDKNIKFWDNVYGFKMTCVKCNLRKNAIVVEVKPETVCSDSFCIKEIDAKSVDINYTEFQSRFQLTLERDSKVSAICGYFNVDFSNQSLKKVSFSTGPKSTLTHWQQVVFLLQNPITLMKGERLKGEIALKRDSVDPRSLKINVKTDLETTDFFLKSLDSKLKAIRVIHPPPSQHASDIISSMRTRLPNCDLKCFSAAPNNIPDENSVAATEQVIEAIENVGKWDSSSVIFNLISGGGSALLSLPLASLCLSKKVEVIVGLNKAGASIFELNKVRAALSRVKGGKLLDHVPANSVVVNLIMSDIVGDPIELIAGGATVPQDRHELVQCSRNALNVLKKYELLDTELRRLLSAASTNFGDKEEKKRDLHNLVVCSNSIAVECALKEGKSKFDFDQVVCLTNTFTGTVEHLVETIFQVVTQCIEKSAQSSRHICLELENPLYDSTLESQFSKPSFTLELSKPETAILLVVAGESTMSVSGAGLGGRNQHVVLLALKKFIENFKVFETHKFVFLSAGTDGQDGPTDAAGAVVDSDIAGFVLNSEALLRSLQLSISSCDSHGFFTNLDSEMFKSDCKCDRAHVKTGLTGTNVMDLVFVALTLSLNSNQIKTTPKKHPGKVQNGS